MATQVKTRIKNRIDSKQAWQQANPVLLCGEIAVETGSYGAKFKVGDGLSQYNDLPYAGGSTVSVDGRPNDLGVLHLAKDEYDRRLAAGTLLSNELYVVSSNYIDAYGQQMKNIAPGTDLSDAVNLWQLSDAVGGSYKKSETSSAAEIQSAFELSSGNKVFIDDRILSSSGYSDLSVVRLSASEYDEIAAGGMVLSNALYVIEGDFEDAGGQQIKNVADPTDLSDAATKGYVDGNFQPAGDYLTAVPSDYKTYAATLSSLSSTYSLTSHTHGNYVPTSRTVAGQQLTANVTAATISSAIGLGGYSLTSHNHDSAYAAKSHTHDGYVPTSRTVAGKALTANIAASDISTAIGLGNYSLTSHTHADYVPTSRKINGTALTTDLNVGTITGITMNGASKGTTGNVDLGTVLTAHQSLTGYVQTSRKVAGQALTADVTAATISSAIGLSGYLPLKGGTIANPNGYTDLWLSDGKTNGYAELGVEKGNHYIELYCTSTDSYIDADNYTYRFPNKNGTLARQEDLNYALSTATGVLSSGSYVYDVADRTVTTIGINQSTTPVIVRLPDAGSGARDFILRIEISSETAPTFMFTNTAGLDFESEDDDWAVMQPGVNLISFTETKR